MSFAPIMDFEGNHYLVIGIGLTILTLIFFVVRKKRQLIKNVYETAKTKVGIPSAKAGYETVDIQNESDYTYEEEDEIVSKMRLKENPPIPDRDY